MKILQVAHGFPPKNIAGTEIYTYNLSQELAKRHSLAVFYRESDLKKKEYQLNHNKVNGLDIFTINNTFRYCDSFEGLYKNDDIARGFRKVLESVKPDIVHIQHLIFLSSTIITEVKKRGIPVVFTLHDYWLICPQWHCLKKDLSICDTSDISQCQGCLTGLLSIRKLPKRIYLALRNILPDSLLRFLRNSYFNLAKASLDPKAVLEKITERRSQIKKACANVDLFIAPSEFLRKRFVEFGIPEEKIKLIPHGINRGFFKDFKREGSQRIRFGFVGTILPAKGIDLLIRAFNRIEGDRAELKVYGSLFPCQGFEYYPKYLKELAKSRNIRFMGAFAPGNIASVFSGIDLLVVPSIWNENCPLIVLEAFSTNTPVIASRIGGLPELVTDKENGLLFEAGDTDGLYDTMEACINNPHLIKEMQGKVTLPKSIEDNGQEIEGLYNSLLNNRF